MRRRAPVIVLASTLLAMMSGTVAYAQFGGLLGGAVKILGVGYVVKTFGPQINTFLNSVLAEHNAGKLPATKVVPIIRVGGGTYVGAVQVAGRPDLVKAVQGAAEGQLDFGNQRVQLRYLIPINSLNVLKGIPKRITGVGVSAILDFHV